MHVRVGRRTFYLVAFMDEYSRYIVHHELLWSMDGATVSLEAQAALETLARGADEGPLATPAIRSDNGGGYVSHEFHVVPGAWGLTHHRVRPHCPEENGLMERANRTLREALEGEELTDLLQAREVLARIVRQDNEERLHSALGYLRPVDYYRGDPARLHEARRVKLAAARHARREANLNIRQLTLPLGKKSPKAEYAAMALMHFRPPWNPIYLAKWLGHRDINTTFKIYGHWMAKEPPSSYLNGYSAGTASENVM